MFRALKKIGCAILLAGLAQSAFGYALLGPIGIEPWQVPTIGYGIGGDVGTPRNINEEYRWNTPVLYYAYDNNFLTYFGSNGVTAVDNAIAIINNLTNFSAMSSDLSEFPMEAQHINYTAQALSLFDLKSAALHIVVEELGLAEPTRWVWTLRNRVVGPGGCPTDVLYEVIQRNWDPVFTNQPVNTSYVNGILYDYAILEICSGPNPLAVTANSSPDPTIPTPTAVADLDFNFGYYYTGLSRDDVGGLRYLMITNNVNFEGVSSDSLMVFTNTTNPQLLVTSNLEIFLEQAATNDAPTMATLYPGLIISATTNYFTNIVTTNITAYLTNPPLSYPGTLVAVFVTNYTTNAATLFSHTFANVVTNHYYTNGFLTVQVTNVTTPPRGQAGYTVTNVASTNYFTNFVNGDFYLIPSNALCSSSGFQIISTQLVSVTTITNVFGTNSGTGNGTLTNGQSVAFTEITYFTNYSLVVYPIQCLTNTASLREGIDKITFVRTSFDSLIGQAFTPITNYYSLMAITNSTNQIQTFQRIIVNEPDFLFSAEDRGAEGTIGPELGLGFRTVPNWITNFIPTNNPGAAYGPGTMQPKITIEFNKVGVLLENIWDPLGSFYSVDGIPVNSGLIQSEGLTNYVWASYDGTTNAPVIYPDGSSLNDLENEVLLQVTTPSLPDATNGVAYSWQLQGSGGQLPYTWSLATNSAALPTGLSISAAGLISGTPATATGTYDFDVAFTEAGSRSTSRPLSITVH